MKKIMLSMVISLVFLNIGCGDDLLKHRHTKNPTGSLSGGSSAPGWVSRDIEVVKKEFEDALAGKIKGIQFAKEKRLSSAILAAMDNNVPPQGKTPWSCGLISSKLTVAAAQLEIDKKVVKQSVSQCSVVGKYPLVLNLNIATVAKLPAFAGILPVIEKIFPIEDIGADKYMRVGALPRGIENYLNMPDMLPPKIRANLKPSSTLDEAELIALIQSNVDKNLPTPFLHWLDDPKLLRLHYVVAVGVSDDDNTILYMDTNPQGKDRLQTKSTAELLGQLDMSKVRARLEEFKDSKLEDIPDIQPFKNLLPPNLAGSTVFEVLTSLKALLGNDATIPTPADIAGIANFNLITFDITP